MEFMFEWEQEGDRFSFEDSDRFEEDSLCSWISEPESLCNNWRGWRKPNSGGGASTGGLPQNQLGIHNGPLTTSRECGGRTNDCQIQSLVELAAQAVAYHIPFEVVERFYPPIPEQLQLRIAFWSFPENEEDIRLYSCLANGSADEFQKGEQLFKGRAVNDALQIGFHLSATVVPLQPVPQTAGVSGASADPSKMACNVALVFDRRHITSCSCTCTSGATWCAHIVALCLFRIHQSSHVRLRAPVSESLSRLERDQLQKFAQYLISELPQQILPTAQRLLDELLSSQQTEINTLCGAPDPTAGPSASDLTRWHLDSSGLQENIKKTLSKFCVPSPMVLSDVNYLSNSAPPAATEWQTLLRPLRGREPEGIWNLLSIVREMFRRNDSNAVTLLDIITEELLSCDQILIWWFNNKTSNQSNIYFHGNRGGGGGGGQGSGGGCSTTAPHAAAGLCDEVVTLWRLAALNPSLSVSQRGALCTQLCQSHTQCLERIRKAQLVNQHQQQHGAAAAPRRSELESVFPGFKPAIDACQLDWTNLSLPIGVGELLKHRGHWSLGNKLPTSPVVVSFPPVTDHTTDGNVSGRESGSDVSVRPKEIGRKVLMPSERPAPSVRPWGSTSRKSDREDVDNMCADRSSAELMSPSGVSDTKQATESTSSAVTEDTCLEAATKTETQLDTLFALAEALHAHGNTKEACKLARQLAEEMLSSTSNSEFSGNNIDNSTHHAKGDKVRKATVQSFAGSTLAKASFLCTVLLEDPDSRHLAFRVGLYGMEMARPPAANKSLEVKLAHQESELANQLKKLPLGLVELAVIRDRAEKLRDGKLKTRGDSLLPITLASFIFDSLCANQVVRTQSAGQSAAISATSNLITPQDEKLGFEAAVAALGLKANLTEAEHPILCEGTRRQKGELAVAMLVQYKDDTSKLARIMDKLLDKEVHQLYKSSGHDTDVSNYLGSKHDSCDSSASKDTTRSAGQQSTGDEGIGVEGHDDTKTAANSTSFPPSQNSCRHSSSKSKTSQAGRLTAAVDDLALDDDTEGSGDYKAWEAKFRCTNLKTAKKHSVGMASVDSSAPETTSSDNSPTLVRRSNFSNLTSGVATPLHHGGPGSDSGSSHSDSVDSSSSGCKQSQQPQQLRTTFKTQQQPESDSFLNSYDSASGFTPQMCVYTRTSGVGAKGSRYKVGKNRIMPLLPNQPSEASAHFMFELAKTVLIKAGGNSSTSLFVNQPPAASSSPTHRALHLCALQIGLYALGLNNCVSPNWLSRTYSSHVSWITGQAIEIGYHAVEVLIKTWEGHLTPQEAASLADRASRCRDQHMVRAAAELALSCLPHAHALNPQEIQRALLQCKEQSSDMLQRACLSVENTAKEGGVCPEVLFEVAKRWYELYEERGAQGSSNPTRGSHPSAVVPPLSAAAAAAAFQDLRDNAIAMVSMPPPVIPDNVAIMQLSANNAGPAAVMNQNMTGYPPPGSVPFVPQQSIQLMTHPYAQYTFVHQMAPANQQSAPQPRQNFPYYTAVPIQTNSQPMHLARYPYQGPYMTSTGGIAQPSMSMPPPPVPQMGMGPSYLPGSATMYNMSSVRPPPVQLAYLASVPNMLPPVSSGYSSAQHMMDPNVDQHHYHHPQQQHQQQQQQQQQQQHHQAVEELPGAAAAVGVSNDIHINYLLAAFRVGMLAMDTLAKRVHDDRPQIKYARNPPYGEDVKWLFGISCKLGTGYLQQFCASVVNTIVSPFVLLDIAMETASFLAINNMSQVSQQIRLPMLNSLLQKCLQMFGMCTQTRLHHIASTDYDDFVNIVCSARNAFCMVPGGMTQFNDMLQAIRRSKYCKKDLWQRVISGLHSTNNV